MEVGLLITANKGCVNDTAVKLDKPEYLSLFFGSTVVCCQSFYFF